MGKKALWFLTIPALALIVMALEFGCGSDQPQVKSRIPTVGQQLEQAQQAAQDAKAAADRAQQTAKDIQTNIDRLNNSGRNPDGTFKEGHPEQSGAGQIVSFGSSKIPADANLGATEDSYLDFTFTQRDGFTKRFFPTCPDQNLQVNKSIVLMYHWKSYEGQGFSKRGCYVIDGQQAQ